MLKEGEEILFQRPLPTASVERLNTIKEGCKNVLVDLQDLVKRYESLGTQSKRTWDRMRWGNEDVAEIRARLTSNISLLTAFINTSQIRVETKLDKFIEEFRQGRKETSIVSLQTADSLTADDRAAWRTIRKELEEIGIGVAAFDANRNFIFDWFMRAVKTGAFEEQNARNTDDESKYSDEQKCESSEADEDGDMGQQVEEFDSESLKSIHGRQQSGRQQSSTSTHESEFVLLKRGPTLFDRIFASIYPRQRTDRRVPGIAAFLTGMSRPRQRLMKAVTAGDLYKALKILKDEPSTHVLDSGTLDRALWSATRQGEIHGSYLLLAELIARGGNVNYVSSNVDERTPLWNSVANGSFHTVRLLIESGVDVKYTGSRRSKFSIEAYDFAPRAALKQNPAMLRLLISSGVDVNVPYAVRQNQGLGALLDKFHRTNLIHEAALLGAVSAIETLLEHGAEINAASPRYGTALMAALVHRQEGAAEFLLVRGSDPNIRAASDVFYKVRGSTRGYQTPIEAAMVGGKPSMVRLLLNQGAVPHDSALTFAPFVEEYRSDGLLAYDEEDHEIMEMLEEAVGQERP